MALIGVDGSLSTTHDRAVICTFMFPSRPKSSPALTLLTGGSPPPVSEMECMLSHNKHFIGITRIESSRKFFSFLK